jgi:hypothetical protein
MFSDNHLQELVYGHASMPFPFGVLVQQFKPEFPRSSDGFYNPDIDSPDEVHPECSWDINQFGLLE